MLGCEVGLEDARAPAFLAPELLEVKERAYPAYRPPPPYFGFRGQSKATPEPVGQGPSEVPGLLPKRRIIDAPDCACRSIADCPEFDRIGWFLGCPPTVDLAAQAVLGARAWLAGQFWTTTVPPTGSGMFGEPTVGRLDDHENGLQVTSAGILSVFVADPPSTHVPAWPTFV